MPETRPPYSPEFRRQIVDLVRAGRDPAELAREFEPTAQSISGFRTRRRLRESRLFVPYSRKQQSSGRASLLARMITSSIGSRP